MPLRNPIIPFFRRLAQRRTITLYLSLFALIYVLLMLPWPGWGGVYSAYFRALGSAVFAGESGRRELTFEAPDETQRPSFARIAIINRSLMHEDGSGPVRNLDINTLEFGWSPTALLVALIAATPIPWWRRGRALLWGLLSLHVLLLLFLGFCIWKDSSEILLVTLSPFWKHFTNELLNLLKWQYSVVIPVVVWILVTFRGEDRLGVIGLSLFGSAKGAGVVAPEQRITEIQTRPQKKGN